MSLVGTRPPTVDEWDKYELHHRARLATKPGLTGMWQVSGRSNITDFEEVVKLDKQYISEWTMGLDIHFKKRNLQKEDFDACSTRAFFIGPNGFEEKNGKAQIQDVERINPFHGKQFERKELKKLQRMEEKQRWKERFSRLLRKKN